MTRWLVDMPDDSLREIIGHLSPEDFDAVRLTCSVMRRSYDDAQHFFASAYVERVLGDAAFWDRALARPPARRRSLSSFHLELSRLHAFLTVSGWTTEVFVAFWRSCDGGGHVSATSS